MGAARGPVPESFAAALWIINELRAASALEVWRGDDVPDDQEPDYFRLLINRTRDVAFTPRARAWAEDVWLIEAVTSDSTGERALELSALIDATFGGRVPRTNVPGPYGSLIVSCRRYQQIPVYPVRRRGGNLYHAGGMYQIRTQVR